MPKIEFDADGHRYTVDGRQVPSVTQILEKAGLTANYTGISPAVLAYARDRGVHVDACCDLFDQGDLDVDSIHPDAVPYVQAWGRFCKEQQFVPFVHQGVIYHPELEYAGTFDVDGFIADVPVLVERKCTAKISPTFALQTAAYTLPGVWLHNHPGEKPYRYDAIVRRLVVQLKPDGTYRLAEHTNPLDFEAFKAAIIVARWRNGNGK